MKKAHLILGFICLFIVIPTNAAQVKTIEFPCFEPHTYNEYIMASTSAIFDIGFYPHKAKGEEADFNFEMYSLSSLTQENAIELVVKGRLIDGIVWIECHVVQPEAGELLEENDALVRRLIVALKKNLDKQSKK